MNNVYIKNNDGIYTYMSLKRIIAILIILISSASCYTNTIYSINDDYNQTQEERSGLYKLLDSTKSEKKFTGNNIEKGVNMSQFQNDLNKINKKNKFRMIDSMHPITNEEFGNSIIYNKKESAVPPKFTYYDPYKKYINYEDNIQSSD